MKTNYETGHAVNVAHFDQLCEYVISMGASYTPPDPRMSTGNMHNKLTAAQASLAAVDDVTPHYLKIMSEREEAFAPLSKLATRIGIRVEMLHIDPATAKAVKELIRKLHGSRSVAKKDVPQEEHKYISVSQLSFDQRIENFNKLVDILRDEPLYDPTEADLKTSYLYNMLATMRTTNHNVVDAEIPVTQARNSRNKILYAPLDGLVDIALDVKKYVKSSFGPNSDEYNEIKGLKFTRPR